MTSSAEVGRAKALALVAHAKQKDQTGKPYFEHPLRIANRIRQASMKERGRWTWAPTAAEAVAYLHDVVEDTSITLDQLREFGFSPEVVDAVEAITHLPGEPNEDYWLRVKANEVARCVKLFDIRDNLLEYRLKALPEDLQARLRKKYARALEVLAE